MALYVPQLTFNKFRKGEVVEIDEAEFGNLIERGWLKPYTEGEVVASPGAEGPASDAPADDASSLAAAPGDAPPSEEISVDHEGVATPDDSVALTDEA